MYTSDKEINKIYLIYYYCCCLGQVFFIKNLFHLITTLRCSNIDQDSQPNTPTHTLHPTPTHTHPPRKEERGKRERGPAPHHTPHHNTSTHNPLSYHAPRPHYTQRERGKWEGKGGPFVCGVGTMCGMSVGCKRICCGAGVMWCSAGEKKRKREKRGKE